MKCAHQIDLHIMLSLIELENEMKKYYRPGMSLARHRGFTLLEIMITVVIVAILASIAVPSYSKYVKQSRRSDGMAELTRVMQRQEKFFVNDMTYTTNLSNLGLATSDGKVVSEGGYYLVSVAACTSSTIARCVVATARPQDAQASDGWLSLDSRGQRLWEKNASGETGWP